MTTTILAGPFGSSLKSEYFRPTGVLYKLRLPLPLIDKLNAIAITIAFLDCWMREEIRKMEQIQRTKASLSKALLSRWKRVKGVPNA